MRLAQWFDRAVPFCLAAVWLAVVGATLWLDAQLSPDIPKVDDWTNFVPVLADPRLVTPAWLWSQTFDHRIPLARLGYLASYYALGQDFRAASFLGTVLLGLMALLGMVAARRVRGRSSLADVFFPLMLLHWGQAQKNYVIGTGLHFNLTYVFYYPALYLLLLPAETFTVRRAALWTLLVLGLPLCGMMGVVLAVPLALVLLVLGLVRLLGPTPERRSGLCFLLLGLAVLALIGCYFKDYVAPLPTEAQRQAPVPGCTGKLSTGAIILAMSLGWLGWKNWQLASLVLLVVGLVTTGVLARVWLRQPAERWRAGGLLAFLLGTAALIVGTGSARAWMPTDLLWCCTRYAVFSIPVVVMAYLVCVRYASARLTSWIQGALAVLSVVVFLGTATGAAGYPHALTAIQRRGTHEREFIRRSLEGEPLAQVTRAAGYWEDQTTTFVFGTVMKEHCLGLFGLSAVRRSDYLDWWQPSADRPSLLIGSHSAEKYLGPGWAVEGERSGRNTNARSATFRFAGTPGRERKLSLEVAPFTLPGKVEQQRVRLRINGSPLTMVVLTDPCAVEGTIPGRLLREQNDLTLELLDAVIPRDIGYNEGGEPIAVRVKRIRME